MVKFISLFLGLVAGLQPVELVVEGEVATVELRLDGSPIATLSEEPWLAACDFGEDLAPHVLVAIGKDAQGREVARTEQWVNLPRERVVMRFELEGEPPQTARLLWRSVEGLRPDLVRVAFDGKVLETDDEQRVRLPKYDPAIPHLLSGEMQFDREAARTEVVLGGAGAEVVDQQLTAFPVLVAQGKAPSAAEMRGWFTKHGRPLDVVAVDEGPAEIVMVQDQSRRIQGQLAKLERDFLGFAAGRNRRPTGMMFGDRLRVLLPIQVTSRSQHPLDLFPLSADLAAQRDEPRSMGASQRQIATPVAEGVLAALPFTPGTAFQDQPQRLADGVAVAGLTAASGGRPRVVVLVANAETADQSTHEIASVRAYLNRLQVPLIVWAPEMGQDWEAWGGAENIAHRGQLFRTIKNLRSLLDRQVVVWLSGRHLPQEIQLSEAAGEKLQLVSSFAPSPVLEPEFEAWIAALEAPAVPAEEQEAAAQETGTSPSTPEEAPAPAEASATPPAVEPVESFVESVEVQIVNVDVVVSGKDGEKLRDLTAEDFEISEDGEPVEITHFVPPKPLERGAGASGESAEAEGDASASPAVTSEAPMHLVVFVDASNLEVKHRKQIFPALREVLVRDPLPGKVMLVVYGLSVGIRQTFTSDPAILAAALDNLETNAGAALPRAQEGRQVLREMMEFKAAMAAAERITSPEAREFAIETAKSIRTAALRQLNGLGEVEQREIRTLLANLGQLSSSLGGVEGRKALIYVGDRLTLNPAGELYTAATEILELEPFEVAPVEMEAQSLNLYRDFQAMLRRSNASGVTFYAMTPPDLDLFYTASMRGFGSGLLGEARGRNLAGFATRLGDVKVANIKEAACLMSGATGGICQVGGSEPRILLERTLEDLQAAYALAYSPRHHGDGEYHEIEVKVKRPGVRVRHREGYLSVPPDGRLQDRLRAALLFDVADNALGLELSTEAPQDLGQKGLRVLPLEVRVPVKHLALLPVPNAPGKRGAKLRLLLSVLDGKGQNTEIQELPLAFQVNEERLANPTPLVYAHKVHLTMPQGATRVAVGLWDEVGRSGSFAGREIEPN